MKVLLIFYESLLQKKEEILRITEENYRILRKNFGIDNLYAAITKDFIDIFFKFPEICLINNVKGSINYGAYKGLRKLKGDDILIIDGGVKLREEIIKKIFVSVNPYVLLDKGKWSGIAFIPMKEVYYFIRSIERNFNSSITEAFKTLKNSYGISFETFDINKI